MKSIKHRNILAKTTSDKISNVLNLTQPYSKRTKRIIFSLFDDGYRPDEISRELGLPFADIRSLIQTEHLTKIY